MFVYGCDRSTNPIWLKIDIHVRYTKIRDEIRVWKKNPEKLLLQLTAILYKTIGSGCVRLLYKMVT